MVMQLLFQALLLDENTKVHAAAADAWHALLEHMPVTQLNAAAIAFSYEDGGVHDELTAAETVAVGSDALAGLACASARHATDGGRSPS
mmetsp:Transcript_10321/g.31685  ORF Transcript_10321/g.31685 Transcript_10321/m.31685 type:complete len:89 (-) Transcript_10321:396-662(-)|eukprot:scaffold223534_cov25-Tisochrysis_lutea.AAC.3